MLYESCQFGRPAAPDDELLIICQLVRQARATFYILAAMHLKTGRVHIAGMTTNPNGTWMKQICRNLTDCEDGVLKDASHLIVDRDNSFLPMRAVLEESTATKVVLLPPKSPNLNTYMERWFRSLKSECHSRMSLFGGKPFKNVVREYVKHYYAERNHPSLSNQFIEAKESVAAVAGKIECRELLGGMLKYYHRRVA